MKSSNELRTLLRSIDRKSYPAYKSLSGAYQFGAYVLVIDHVQGDPFASPSSVHIEVSLKQAGFPEAYYQEACSRIALEDFLTRRFGSQVEAYSWRFWKKRAVVYRQMWAGGFGEKRLSDWRRKDYCQISYWISGIRKNYRCRRTGKNTF